MITTFETTSLDSENDAIARGGFCNPHRAQGNELLASSTTLVNWEFSAWHHKLEEAISTHGQRLIFNIKSLSSLPLLTI